MPLLADTIEIGSYCWRRASEDLMLSGEGREGTVVRIEEHVDPETGELSRRYVVVRQYRGQVRWASILEPDLGDVALPNSATIRSLLRAMGRAMGERRGPITSTDVDLHQAMGALLEVVA